MIAEAAYLRAEQRGFSGGDSVADWLAAEKEVDHQPWQGRCRTTHNSFVTAQRSALTEPASAKAGEEKTPATQKAYRLMKTVSVTLREDLKHIDHDALEQELTAEAGIHSIRYHRDRNHTLTVDYDPAILTERSC
jgi:hypothetical protein